MFSNHGHLRFEAITDANRAGSVDERGSASSYCTFVREILSIFVTRNRVVARPNVDVEYRVMVHGSSEIM